MIVMHHPFAVDAYACSTFRNAYGTVFKQTFQKLKLNSIKPE